MKQTAVSLLKEILDSEMKLGTKMIVNWDMYLEIEKQQIMNAYDCGSNASLGISKDSLINGIYGNKGSEIGNSLEWNGEVTQGNKGNEIKDEGDSKM